MSHFVWVIVRFSKIHDKTRFVFVNKRMIKYQSFSSIEVKASFIVGVQQNLVVIRMELGSKSSLKHTFLSAAAAAASMVIYSNMQMGRLATTPRCTASEKIYPCFSHLRSKDLSFFFSFSIFFVFYSSCFMLVCECECECVSVCVCVY